MIIFAITDTMQKQ